MRRITTKNALLNWLRDQVTLVEPRREMPAILYTIYADIFELIKEDDVYRFIAKAPKSALAEWYDMLFEEIVDEQDNRTTSSIHIFTVMSEVLARGARGETVALSKLIDIVLPIVELEKNDLRTVNCSGVEKLISSSELERRYGVRIQVPVNTKKGRTAGSRAPAVHN